MNTDEHGLKTAEEYDASSAPPPIVPSSVSHLYPSLSIRGSSARILITSGILATTTLVGLLLFFFDPAGNAFYPGCVFHKLTGLSCPGCGGLRASHRLLHGHIAEAFRLNPLLIVLSPIFAWWTLREVVRFVSGKVLPSILPWQKCGWFFLALTIVFTVVRNLPWPQFSWMAAP